MTPVQRKARRWAQRAYREIEELRSRAEAAEAARDCFRAVLEGAEYQQIDDLPTKGVSFCKRLGEATNEITKMIGRELDAERAAKEAAIVRAEGAERALHENQGSQYMTHQIAELKQAKEAAIALIAEAIGPSASSFAALEDYVKALIAAKEAAEREWDALVRAIRGRLKQLREQQVKEARTMIHSSRVRLSDVIGELDALLPAAQQEPR
jgi:cation transport regulator ChaC